MNKWHIMNTIEFINLTLVLFMILTSCSNSQNKFEDIKVNLVSKNRICQILEPRLISTHLYERDFSISPDKKQIAFTRGDNKQNRRYLMSMTKLNGQLNKV